MTDHTRAPRVSPLHTDHPRPRRHVAPAHRPWAAARPTHGAHGDVLFACGALVTARVCTVAGHCLHTVTDAPRDPASFECEHPAAGLARRD